MITDFSTEHYTGMNTSVFTMPLTDSKQKNCILGIFT